MNIMIVFGNRRKRGFLRGEREKAFHEKLSLKATLKILRFRVDRHSWNWKVFQVGTAEN